MGFFDRFLQDAEKPLGSAMDFKMRSETGRRALSHAVRILGRQRQPSS